MQYRRIVPLLIIGVIGMVWTSLQGPIVAVPIVVAQSRPTIAPERPTLAPTNRPTSHDHTHSPTSTPLPEPSQTSEPLPTELPSPTLTPTILVPTTVPLPTLTPPMPVQLPRTGAGSAIALYGLVFLSMLMAVAGGYVLWHTRR